jgi:tetratricopeptide (TPR) repeat protein
VNPYGAQSFLFAWTIFGEARESLFKEVIAELQSPLAFGFRYSATVGLLVLTCVFALTLLSSIRRLDPFLTIVSVAMGVLAWSAVRNIPLFAVAALPFIVWHLRAEEPLRAKPFLTLFTVAASAFFIWAMGTDRLHLWQNESNQFGAGLAERRFPLAVVDGLVKSNPSRPVFNSMEIGGLLRWRGVPYYVDARLEVFGERVYERYFDAAKTRNELARILDEYQMEDAVVSITSPFVPLLLSMEGWSLAAYDANGCWFSRRVRANQPVALELPGPPVPYRSAGLFTRCLSPTPYLNLAILYDHLNQTGEALRWSDAALQAYPNGLGIESVRGSLLYRLGRMDEARAAFERAVALDPEDASAWSGLGAVLATEGRSEDAKRSLNRALQIEPRDANAWMWLASVKAQEQDLAGAAAALEQAIQVGGENSNALAFLGDVQQARGLMNAAEQAYRKALSMDPTNRRAAAGAIVLLRRKGDEAGARRVLEAYERATGKADDELKGLFR